MGDSTEGSSSLDCQLYRGQPVFTPLMWSEAGGELYSSGNETRSRWAGSRFVRAKKSEKDRKQV